MITEQTQGEPADRKAQYSEASGSDGLTWNQRKDEPQNHDGKQAKSHNPHSADPPPSRVGVEVNHPLAFVHPIKASPGATRDYRSAQPDLTGGVVA